MYLLADPDLDKPWKHAGIFTYVCYIIVLLIYIIGHYNKVFVGEDISIFLKIYLIVALCCTLIGNLFLFSKSTDKDYKNRMLQAGIIIIGLPNWIIIVVLSVVAASRMQQTY